MNDIRMTTATGPGLRNGERFRVSVEFLSDWACGTGTGRHGAVDREVLRDPDGLPMVRGKTLVAMFRDAAETVAAGLDEGPHGLWHRWVGVLFGGQQAVPGQGAESLDRSQPSAAALRGARPLHLAGPVRAKIANLDERSRHLVQDATVSLRPGVRIDPETGTATDDMFRIEERASAGLTVVANWHLRFDGLGQGSPVPWEAEFLLLAAARMVDAIGSKRRRGAGRCRVEIAVPDVGGARRLTELLDLVDSARSPAQALATGRAAGAAAQAPVAQAESLGARSSAPPRHRYGLRITALTPLLVRRGVVGNIVLTERFIPGTLLLPAVARALGARATELITGGRVVVTDATIEIDGQRSWPLPRALHAEKGHAQSGRAGLTLVNLLSPRDREDQRLRPLSTYCVPNGADIRVATPDLVEQAHAVVDDEHQRPNEKSGGLFVYEAMAPGTVLRAEVWLPDDVPFDTGSLVGERGIGWSKKDDYGHVRIEVFDPPSTSVRPPVFDGVPGELLVWLLSDVLLFGDAGQPVAEVGRLAEVLGEALGVELTLPDATEERPSALVTSRRVESWQRRWSLPRPSLTGLAAGSVVRFRMVGMPSDEAYRRVEACGLGERTVEGFGRIALRPRLLAEATVAVLPAPEGADGGPPADPELTDSEARMVAELQVRGWGRELRRCARARAQDSEVRKLLVPPDATAAQLGTLRTLADRLAIDGDPTAVLAWLTGTGLVGRRREAWHPDRLDRLARLASGDAAELWKLLDVAPPAEAAEPLFLPALSWLLAESARAQVATRAGQAVTNGDESIDAQEVPA